MKKQSKAAARLVLIENNDAITAQTQEIQNRIRERTVTKARSDHGIFAQYRKSQFGSNLRATDR